MDSLWGRPLFPANSKEREKYVPKEAAGLTCGGLVGVGFLLLVPIAGDFVAAGRLC